MATALVLASLGSAGVLLPVLHSGADGETKMTVPKYAFEKLGELGPAAHISHAHSM